MQCSLWSMHYEGRGQLVNMGWFSTQSWFAGFTVIQEYEQACSESCRVTQLSVGSLPSSIHIHFNTKSCKVANPNAFPNECVSTSVLIHEIEMVTHLRYSSVLTMQLLSLKDGCWTRDFCLIDCRWVWHDKMLTEWVDFTQ